MAFSMKTKFDYFTINSKNILNFVWIFENLVHTVLKEVFEPRVKIQIIARMYTSSLFETNSIIAFRKQTLLKIKQFILRANVHITDNADFHNDFLIFSDFRKQ